MSLIRKTMFHLKIYHSYESIILLDIVIVILKIFSTILLLQYQFDDILIQVICIIEVSFCDSWLKKSSFPHNHPRQGHALYRIRLSVFSIRTRLIINLNCNNLHILSFIILVAIHIIAKMLIQIEKVSITFNCLHSSML